MRLLNLIPQSLLIIAIVFATLAHLMPWADLAGTFDLNLWTLDGESDDTWFDGEYDGEDGIGAVRTGIILFAASSLFILAAPLAGLSRNPTAMGILALMGGLLAIAGTAAYMTGIDDMLGAAREIRDWQAGFAFGWTVAGLALIAAFCSLGYSAAGLHKKDAAPTPA